MLCWGLTSQSTIFQSCRDGAIASWVINQYFRGVKCLAQGHNTAAVGLEPRTSRSGVWHSTTEPPRSPFFFKWAISWDYGTFHPPQTHSSNAHAQPSSGAKCLIFGQILHLRPYFMCANSEGSGETARMRRLTWAFGGRLCDKYQNLMCCLKCHFQNPLNNMDSPYLGQQQNLNHYWRPSLPRHGISYVRLRLSVHRS